MRISDCDRDTSVCTFRKVIRKICIIRGLPIFGHDRGELQLLLFQCVTLIIANN